MASPSEKLAQSLEVLRKLQSNDNVAIKNSEISRTHRERLVKAGFLKKVTKAWYIVSNPSEAKGDSTSWYSSYWKFCARYLQEKYGTAYCLSAEQSLMIHSGNTTVPHQMVIRSPKAPNKTIALIHDTTLYILKSPLEDQVEKHGTHGLQIMTKEAALINSSPIVFKQNALEVRIVLAQIKEASRLLKILLERSHSVKAGRLVGAFQNLGMEKIANDIVKTMQAADYKINVQDPFETATPKALVIGGESPYANRIRLQWAAMREIVIANFPKAPGIPNNIKKYLAAIDELYVTDAYHSLSIERYYVSKALIEKVKSGDWDLQKAADQKQREAMAARGYWEATQSVKKTIEKILKGENAGRAFDADHGDWYQALFAPSVSAGLLRVTDLAGYRSHQVYISNSKHIPMNSEALRAAMPVLVELLINEPEASVRVVLGHFFFVYIHPYMDGNGRMARFLMNVMLASGGYPWTVIPVGQRAKYMSSLETASVENKIKAFSKFLAKLVQKSIDGKPMAK